MGVSNDASLAARLIRVPADFSAIQDAIDSASNGDMIIVRDGTYLESIDFRGKAITIRSENGPQGCILRGQEVLGTLVNFSNGEGLSSVLEGFTITGGASPLGGGIYCQSSSPTIRNCVIAGNYSFYQRGAAYGGAGIYLNQSSAVIEECLIKENVARGGGYGGGIYLVDSPAQIKNCSVVGNMALSDSYEPGSGQGGGIYSVSYSTQAQPIIENCLIAGNLAAGDDISDPGRGGGVYLQHSSPTLSKCTIIGNYAVGSPGSQGYGGGIACCDTASPQIINSLIAGNIAVSGNDGREGADGTEFSGAGLGAGIYCRENSSPTVTNCTIADNRNSLDRADAGQGGAGIVVLENSTPNLTNVILWGNIPAQVGSDAGQVDISFSDVQGGYIGAGNMNADPQFLGAGDYHLTPDSPCIDMGTSTGAPVDDLDGDDRPQMGGYDIGADEYKQPLDEIPPGH